LILRGVVDRRRVTVHAASTALRAQGKVRPLLVDALRDQAKKFRKRFRETAAARRDEEIDESVHDLRTAARRLVAVLDALDVFIGGRRARRFARTVKKILDEVGPLRDLTIQRDIVAKLRARASIVESFVAELRRDRSRIVRTLGK